MTTQILVEAVAEQRIYCIGRIRPRRDFCATTPGSRIYSWGDPQLPGFVYWLVYTGPGADPWEPGLGMVQGDDRGTPCRSPAIRLTDRGNSRHHAAPLGFPRTLPPIK